MRVGERSDEQVPPAPPPAEHKAERPQTSVSRDGHATHAHGHFPLKGVLARTHDGSACSRALSRFASALHPLWHDSGGKCENEAGRTAAGRRARGAREAKTGEKATLSAIRTASTLNGSQRIHLFCSVLISSVFFFLFLLTVTRSDSESPPALIGHAMFKFNFEVHRDRARASPGLAVPQ